MTIIDKTINLDELRDMTQNYFGDMVKAVVDVERALLAADSQLHSDLEAHLIENGSRQADLWGISLYPDMPDEGSIEFDSMINIRPVQDTDLVEWTTPIYVTE